MLNHSILGWERYLFKFGAIVVIPAIVLLSYLNSIDNAFQYDDYHSLVENPHLKDLENVPLFFVDSRLFSEDRRSFMYRPVVLATYAITNHLNPDLLPSGFRWLNIIVHTCNAVLVCVLVVQICGKPWIGLTAGLMFGLHPGNSEVVNYISSRSESIAAFFVLVSANLLAYSQGQRAYVLRAAAYGASLATFAVALGAKSIAITFVLTAPLTLWALNARTSSRAMVAVTKRVLPYWAIGAGYLFIVRGQVSSALVTAPVRGFTEQLLTQLKAIVYYVKLVFVPTNLNVEHQFFGEYGRISGVSVLTILMLLSFAVVSVLLLRDRRQYFYWLVWPCIANIPVFLTPLNVLVNEHRLYLPSIGFCVCVAILFAKFFPVNRRVAVIAGTLLIASYVGLVQQRNVVWKTSESLWIDSLSKSPSMPRPQIFVGDAKKQAGRFEEALTHYNTALDFDSRVLTNIDRVVLHNNMGATYLAMGRFADAADSFQRAVDIAPNYEKARESLEGVRAIDSKVEENAAKLLEDGLRLLVAGRVPAAIERLKSSIQLQRTPDAWMTLALCYQRLGKVEEAERAYETLISMFPNTGFAVKAKSKLREMMFLRDQGQND